ncbi:hypothetical protein ACIRRH_28835 [Kitasatospora sp. NPDC101235]|uniref:hypothetical protein n=1 Tax=Kitasatospora sp. NPDC101235 TaxID=3364101 RepID=UPI00381F49CD
MSRPFPRTAVALAVLASGLLTTWNAPRSVARSPGTRSAERGESADRSAAGRHAARHAGGMRPVYTGTVDEEFGTAPHVVSDLFLGADAAGPARTGRNRSAEAPDDGPLVRLDHGAGLRGPSAGLWPRPRPGSGSGPSVASVLGLVSIVVPPAGAAGSAESAEPTGHAARPPAPPPTEAVQGAAGRAGEAGRRDGLAGVLLVLTGLELITRRVFDRRAGASRR